MIDSGQIYVASESDVQALAVSVFETILLGSVPDPNFSLTH